jgi:uncharacterized protein YndB with AHSA1/START domain
VEGRAEAVELDLEEGGAVRFRWDDGTERTGTVELVAAPVRLGFRWEDGEAGASFVELTLIPVDEGTRLRVVETGPYAPVGMRLQALAACAGAVHA